MAYGLGKIRRNTGANVVVEAFGEVLLLPGGDVNRWNRKFIGAVKRQTRIAAPKNKRPRWEHYGKPLKDTIKGSKPNFFKTKNGGRLYAAVGSTAPHAYYVDQGTGIYNGSGPYQAKVLPPWTVGGASLYESTWRPGIDPYVQGPRTVREVWIKGQKPQYFFTRGLDKAFLSMRLQRSVASPFKIESATHNPMIEGSLNFFGNTENTPAFRASLAEWRTWRDEAWGDFRLLGRAGGLNRRLQGREGLRRSGGLGADDRRFLGLSQKQILAIRKAETLERSRLFRRAKETRDVAESRQRQRLAEERRLLKEEKETRKALVENQARALKRAYKRANRYTLKLRQAYPNAVIRPFANKIGYRVQWTDDSGERHYQDFLVSDKTQD